MKVIFTALLTCLVACWPVSKLIAAQAQGSQPPALLTAPIIQPIDLEPKVTLIQTVHTLEQQKNDARNEVSNVSAKLKPQVAYAGNIIRFTITNPLIFLRSRPTDQSRVVVYINGVELKGISTGWYSSVSNSQITLGKVPVFKNTADIDIALKRNDTTQQAWNFFYNNTSHFYDNYIDVDASVGWEGMSALPKDNTLAHRLGWYIIHLLSLWYG
jgi:hypothetical protein